MLIISAGMPKSGSTYMFHLLNGLAMAAGSGDSVTFRTKHALEDVLGKPNNFVVRIPARLLARLWLVAARERRFVVKTHDPLGLATRLAARFLGVRVVYTFRDPRDCLLSALDYGVKLRERGAGDTYFGRMHSFDDVFPEVKRWIAIGKAYESVPGVLRVKYEDLLATPDDILQRCARHLRVSMDENARAQLLWSCSRDNPEVGRMRMPLNKAVAFRYRTEMPQEQRQRFQDELGEALTGMGFSLD